MKATDLLKEQHQEIDELFERISLAEDGEKSALCSELAASLFGHSTIEKELFYPASREALGASFEIQTALEEHALVDYALQKLLSTDPSDDCFHARVNVLKDLVQHHIEEEEQELLKQAEGAMNVQQLEQLGAQLQARFDEVRRGDAEGMLAKAVAESMPAPAGRTLRGKPARKMAAQRSPTKRAPAKRAPAKRAAAKRTPSKRAEPARAAAPSKGRRGATTGRKKPSSPVPAKSGRATSSRKASVGGGSSSSPTRAEPQSGRTGATSKSSSSPTRAGVSSSSRAGTSSSTRSGTSKSSRTGRKGGRSNTASVR